MNNLYKQNIRLLAVCESVDKIDTLFVEMPFAENRMIFGLHSTPANTTHALWKTADKAVFAKIGVFLPHMSAEKQKCGLSPQNNN